MLIITTDNGTQHTLHVGSVTPVGWLYDIAPGVIAVQADGDELHTIRDQFENLPIHNRGVVRWFGTDAQFIVANIKL